VGQRCPRLKHGRTRDFSRQTGGLLQPNMCECRPITSNIRLPINRKLLGGRLARQLYALRSRLLRPRAENLATSRQPVRPEVVTHVSGTLCYRYLRAGQKARWRKERNWDRTFSTWVSVLPRVPRQVVLGKRATKHALRPHFGIPRSCGDPARAVVEFSPPLMPPIEPPQPWAI